MLGEGERAVTYDIAPRGSWLSRVEARRSCCA